MRLIFLSAILLNTAWAGGVELQIQYSAIQKVLAQQMFSDGKMYVKGTAQNKCSYAFLENPLVEGIEGRIRIKAHFSGKNASSFFGRCLGLGDAFELRIEASPYYQDGVIRLKEIFVETGKDGLYARKVKASITESLPRKFAYQVSAEARRILERTSGVEPYQQKLENFQVLQIRVTPASLVLVLEFTLVVK